MLRVSQYIFILIVGIVTFVSTPEAKAFTYSQTNSDTSTTYSGGSYNPLYQYMGDNLTGVPTQIEVYLRSNWEFSNATPRIYACDISRATSSPPTAPGDVCPNISATSYQYVTNSKELYTFNFASTTFDLTGKRVYLRDGGSAGNSVTTYAYGSSNASSYPDGTCLIVSNGGYTVSTWGSCGSIKDLYFVLTTNGDSLPLIDPDNLQVQAAVPALDAIVATSTPFNFGFTTWVPTGQWTDYISDEKIRVRLALERWSDSVLLDFSTSSLPLNTRLFYMGGVGAGFSDNSTIYEIYETPEEGLYTYSTSTLGIGPLNGNFPTGDYRVRVTIELCPVKVFGICLGWINARRLEAPFNSISLYNNFSAGYHSAVYEELTNVQNAISGVFLQPGTGTTTAYAQNYCNPLSGFDVSKCFAGLLVPSSDQFTKIFNDFQAGFLSRAPWGYFYIAGTILSGYNSVATSSLSASNLAITFPSTGIFATATSTSQFAGKTITIINFDTLIASTSASTGYQNVMASLTNFFNILFGIGFVYWLWSFSVRARL